MPPSQSARPLLALAVGLCAIAHSATAAAQAWLPEAGEVSFSSRVTSLLNKKHYLPNGDEVDVGHTRTQILGLEASWSPGDRWLLTAGIPYVRAKWFGDGHHGPETDTGTWNGTFTDLQLSAHFQALQNPFALAPYVTVVTPVHHYPWLGHSAPGRHLDELRVGLFAGRALDEVLPGAYLQLRYGYAFVEQVQGIRHDNSNLDVELGYFIGTDWLVQVTGQKQWAHGGIDLPVPPTSPLFPDHDRLGAAEFLNLSAGVSWFATGQTAVSLAWTRSLSGSNAHKVDRDITIALSHRLARHR